jgi:transposase
MRLKEKISVKKGYKKLSESEQMKIVQEVENKSIRPGQALKKYGIGQRSLYNWIDKYNLRKLEQETTNLLSLS